MRVININSFKEYCEWLSGKDIAGGYLPPDSFNTALPYILYKVVRKYYGVPEQYQVGNPAPPISYELTQLVTDYIGHLKEDKILNVDDSGRAVKPSDYLHKSSIAATWIDVDMPESEEKLSCCDTVQAKKSKTNQPALMMAWTPVTVVMDNEWAAWTSSSLRKPTKEFPICRFLGTASEYIEFAPADIRAVRFIYLRYPKTPIWNYTNPSGTYPIFNPTGSENIELPEVCADEMATSLLDRLGITIREPQLVDWARYIKQTGM